MELTILQAIEKLQNPILDKISIIMAHLGSAGAIFILIGILFLFHKKTRKMGLHILISLIISIILGNMILKPLINRVRPYEKINRAILVKNLSDGSFPSGHTYAAFATAFSALYHNKKIGVCLILFAILMGFTRLYLYVHYPTDVVGGVILGYVCAESGRIIIKKLNIENILKEKE